MRKINLVATLVHKVRFICFSSRLQAELDKIQSILVGNGHRNHFITSTFIKKIRQFNKFFQNGPKKCLICLQLLWLGINSIKFEKQIITAIQRYNFDVDTRVAFTTGPLLPAIKKVALPAHHYNKSYINFVPLRQSVRRTYILKFARTH